MIDQEKVRDMSRMAMMENGRGEKELEIGTYHLVHYIIRRLLVGIIAGAACYAALFFLWFALRWDTLDATFANGNYFGFLKNLGLYYVVFMVIYLILCTIVAVVQYKKCRQHKSQYTKYLRRLNQAYVTEEAEDEFGE